MNAAQTSPVSLDELISPEDAVATWPVLSLNMLRVAIRNKDLGFVKVGNKKLVTRAAIEVFLATKVTGELPCQTGYSNSTDSGSPPLPGPETSTGTGMTNEAVLAGEKALAQKILNKAN